MGLQSWFFLSLLTILVGCNPLAGVKGSFKEESYNPGINVILGPDELILVQGGGQGAQVGSPLPENLKIKVQDSMGKPLQGVNLSVTVLTGGGAVSSSSVVTDSRGFATFSWILGSVSGVQKLLTQIESETGPGKKLVISATALSGAPSNVHSSISATTGIMANGIARSLVTIVLKDTDQNPILDFVPTFSATNTAGTNAYQSCTASDTQGASICTFSSTVAEVKSLSLLTPIALTGADVTFFSGPAASVSISSGNAQSGTYGAALALPFKALVRDAYNNIVSGAQVNWAVITGTGSLSSSSSITVSDGLASTVFTPGSPGVSTVTATLNSTGSSVTFTGTGLGTSFTTEWPFDIGTSGSYTFTSTLVEVSAGAARLVGNDQRDDDNTSLGFGGAMSSGVLWDAAGHLRLGNSGSCDGGISPCVQYTNPELYELSSATAPKWANIVGYWKLNGSGSLSSGTELIPAELGQALDASNPNATGLKYENGQVSSGVRFDGVDDAASIPTLNLSGTNKITISFWLKWDKFADDDKLVFEISQNSNGNSGGMFIDPNGGGGGLGGSFYAAVSGNAGFNTSSFPRPSAGVFHHYTFVIDKSQPAAKEVIPYVDGVPVAYTKVYNSDNSNNFKNLPAYFMSRSASSLFGVGVLDEFILWNTTLSAAEIQGLYQRQSSKRSGIIISRVMDALSAGQSWTKILWSSALPFFKELPDAACSGATCVHGNSETRSSYPSVIDATLGGTSKDLMTEVLGVWHLNEQAATVGAANDFKDDSGNGFHGEVSGGVVLGTEGKFNKSISLSGTNAYINIPGLTKTQYSNNFSVCVWIKPTALPAVKNSAVSWGNGSIAPYYRFLLGIDSGGAGYFSYYNGANHFFYGDVLPLHVWSHLCVAAEPNGTIVVSTNGKSAAPVLSGPIILSRTDAWDKTTIGVDPSGFVSFEGSIDEVGIWKRKLTSTEMSQLYRRGSNRIKHQVRTCSTSSCSEDPSGANWRGPDGTNRSFFTELNNNSDPVNFSGDVKKNSPELSFANFTNPVGPSQYFQYRTILESEDVNQLCDYGAGAAYCSPELKSVAVDPVHYPQSGPGISGNVGADFYSLAGFSEALGAEGCPEGVVHNLGIGATSATATWYWLSGTNWLTSDGSKDQASTATAINMYLSTFGGQPGGQKVFVKSHLKSAGNAGCVLDKVTIEGLK